MHQRLLTRRETGVAGANPAIEAALRAYREMRLGGAPCVTEVGATTASVTASSLLAAARDAHHAPEKGSTAWL